MERTKNIKIGVITKPHGIKGELRVFPTTDRPEHFERLAGGHVFVGDGNLSMKKFSLDAARISKGMARIRLGGVDDRDAAARLSGMGIFVPEAMAAPLEAGEYFERDLLGMAVVSENGAAVGTVEKVLYAPANDVYVVKPENGPSFMVPAVRDVVLEISGGAMKIRLLDGLADLTV